MDSKTQWCMASKTMIYARGTERAAPCITHIAKNKAFAIEDQVYGPYIAIQVLHNG